MRARRSRLYVGHKFSTATSPVARPPQSMRPSANSDARSWKLRTARDSESLKRSKRAKGEGATGCGTGIGAGGTAAGGGAGAGAGAGAGDPAVVRRRGGAAGGGTALRVVT